LVFDLIAARGREGFLRKCVRIFTGHSLLILCFKKYKQVGFSGIEVSPIDGDVCVVLAWGEPRMGPRKQHGRFYHATSTSSEGDLRHLMETIVSTTPDLTEKDSDFSRHTHGRPPNRV